MCANCICVSVRERERERQSMCFSYIIKHHFVAKTWIWSVVFILLFTIFICLASVIVGFGSFAVLGCKDLWNNANHLAKWYGHVMQCLELCSPCVSLKIIAHLRTFVSQSDSSIQIHRSINLNAWISKRTKTHNVFFIYLLFIWCILYYIILSTLYVFPHSYKTPSW